MQIKDCLFRASRLPSNEVGDGPSLPCSCGLGGRIIRGSGCFHVNADKNEIEPANPDVSGKRLTQSVVTVIRARDELHVSNGNRIPEKNGDILDGWLVKDLNAIACQLILNIRCD